MILTPNTKIEVPKRSRIRLSQNFWAYEFDCRCNHPDCEMTIIDLALVHRCELLRQLRGKGFSPLSAYRCDKHNKDVGGSENSTHKIGSAIDAPLVGHSLELYWFCHLFMGVGDGRKGKHMIHGDIGRQTFTLWTY